MPVIYRPGDRSERDDPVLEQAYIKQDAVIAYRFRTIIDELDAFARADKSVQVFGFDASRYLALERDARQAMSNLHRSLEHWETTL
jgi:hypothetical protein